MPKRPPDPTPVLQLDDASIWRGEAEVVRGLTWRVLPGQHWAVLGANGSGKSSLAAAISGDAASTGEIAYGFEGPNGDPCERIASVSFSLQRAFVAQSDGYYQARWYPGEEAATLTAGQVLSGMAGAGPGTRKKIAAAARTMGLMRLLDRHTLHLSNGEMRRLLIARALLAEPALILLDEPFIGLDVSGRAALSKMLERLMRRGPPIVFFTARPWELPAGITHSLWLRDGRMLRAVEHRKAAVRAESARAFPRPKRAALPPIPVRAPARGGAPVVELTDVTLHAGGNTILRRVNWTVLPDEHWAVSGPNGAGKTTLLSLLLGDHPQAFAQNVRLFGKHRSEHSLWELKGKIGWASPDVTLHYDTSTSTLNFVCTGFFDTLGLYRRCSPKQRRLALKWLRFFGLADAAERPFRALSDGQQKLALVARALVKRPRLLVLDEPCQGLDAASRQRVLDAIEGVCRRAATTLIIVTHYADELPGGITDRLMMKRGRAKAMKA